MNLTSSEHTNKFRDNQSEKMSAVDDLDNLPFLSSDLNTIYLMPIPYPITRLNNNRIHLSFTFFFLKSIFYSIYISFVLSLFMLWHAPSICRICFTFKTNWFTCIIFAESILSKIHSLFLKPSVRSFLVSLTSYLYNYHVLLSNWLFLIFCFYFQIHDVWCQYKIKKFL